MIVLAELAQLPIPMEVAKRSSIGLFFCLFTFYFLLERSPVSSLPSPDSRLLSQYRPVENRRVAVPDPVRFLGLREAVLAAYAEHCRMAGC